MRAVCALWNQTHTKMGVVTAGCEQQPPLCATHVHADMSGGGGGGGAAAALVVVDWIRAAAAAAAFVHSLTHLCLLFSKVSKCASTVESLPPEAAIATRSPGLKSPLLVMVWCTSSSRH